MQTLSVTEQIEEVRRQAVTLLGELDTKGEGFGLPSPPEVLQLYHRELQDNEYKVLVVGEAKRGKSTFVNALIGQDILPTDVDVATSQVFKITPSGREAYRLRFEDGSVREISREDLPLYGAPVMADAGSAPTLNQIVRWIEVDVPVRFLPRGVSVLDTPGLGALYAGHAQITYRFVPEADAVIFVLESGQPVVDEDLKFIEEILGVTRNIFFIQTKIDLFDRENWQAIQRRNQEILAQRFEDRLVDARIWPVSSTNLRKAASWDGKTAEAFLMVSRHRDLEAALRSFLARVAGWGQAAEAMLAAAQYHSTGLKVLSGRLAGASEDSQRSSELLQAATRRKQRFEAEWGLNGRELRALKAEIQKCIFVGKQSFAGSIEPDGEIERTQRAKIDNIKSLEQANTFANQMPEEVVSAAIKRWTEVCEGVQNRCAELLRPLAEAADNVSVPVERDLHGLAVPDGELGEEFKHDYLQMFRSVIGGGTMLSGVATFAYILLPDTLVVATLAPPAALVAIPALLLLAHRAIKDAGQVEVKSAQEELNAKLEKLVLEVHRHFSDVDLTSGRLSLVDEYFKTLERTVNEHIGDLVREKSREANAEIARLTEATKLDAQQRETTSRRLRAQLAEWDTIGKKIKDIMAQIKALKEAGAAPGRATAGQG